MPEVLLSLFSFRSCDMLHMTCVVGFISSSKERKAWIMVVLQGVISINFLFTGAVVVWYY